MIEFATVLYGSQNYGLSGPDSDLDYKVLLCPDFYDFYRYRKVDKSDVPTGYDREHYSPMSIIQFHNLVLKGNPNCIEMLFSTEWQIKNESLRHYIEKARTLLDMGYLAIVWDDFYAAVQGIGLNTIDRNGVNKKTISRACYFFDMMIYVASDCFRMNVFTWRGDKKFQKNARRIRFSGLRQKELDELCVIVKNRFRDDKQSLSMLANQYCVNHREAMLNIQKYADELDHEMQNIVASTIKNELKSLIDKCGHL